MDKNCRRSSPNKQLRTLITVSVLLMISGCTTMYGEPMISGGAGVHVGPNCKGLDELGYSAPFSVQDANDIDALGYSECASFIRNGIDYKN